MKNIIEAINVQIKKEQEIQEEYLDSCITVYVDSLKKEIGLQQAKLLVVESMDEEHYRDRREKKKIEKKQDELYNFAKDTAESVKFLKGVREAEIKSY